MTAPISKKIKDRDQVSSLASHRCFGDVNPSKGHAFYLNRIPVGRRFLTPDRFALDLFPNWI